MEFIEINNYINNIQMNVRDTQWSRMGLAVCVLTLIMIFMHINDSSEVSSNSYESYENYIQKTKPRLSKDDPQPIITSYMTDNRIEEINQKKNQIVSHQEASSVGEHRMKTYKPKQKSKQSQSKKQKQKTIVFNLPQIDPQELKFSFKTDYQLFRSTYNTVKPPVPYYDNFIDSKELLPICAVVLNTNPQVYLSITEQGYDNVQVVNGFQTFPYYLNFQRLFKVQCPAKSIILLVRGLLTKNALFTINRIYQNYNVWGTCGIQGQAGVFQIQSFYYALYQKIQTNDFEGSKLFENKKLAMNLTVLSLMELNRIHMHLVDTSQLFTHMINSPFRIQLSPESRELSERYTKRKPYQTLYSLSQTFHIDQADLVQRLNTMMSGKLHQENTGYAQSYFIDRAKMVRGIEYQEMKNLHPNHFLYLRERLYYRRKYFKEWRNTNQTRFCVIIVSHNNIQNNRYLKVLETLIIQNYTNYHTVFIDDDSTDQTFQKSKEYAEKHMKNIQFVKNKERKYSTYNIKNAADNYCKKDEIMLLLDGDDELIGTQIFNLLNSFYQFKTSWIVYTSFQSNLFTYGTSKPASVYPFNKKRERRHIVGALRTFQRDLYLKILDSDHKDSNGNWLDTLYDEAMQYPMMEMSGRNKIVYIPEICYLYNKNYGDNDDSTKEKMDHRMTVFLEILERPLYQRLETLD